MKHLSARDIAARVEHVQTNEAWPEIWGLRDALVETEKADFLQAVFDQLQAVDRDAERQTRLLDLIVTTDHQNTRPYLRAAFGVVTDPLVKCHLCWILEGNADASFIDVLGDMALHDPDPGVRMCALLSLAFIEDARIRPIVQESAAHDDGVWNGQQVSDVAQKLLDQRKEAT